MKKVLIVLILFIAGNYLYAQSKSTVDRALETTTGILRLLEKPATSTSDERKKSVDNQNDNSISLGLVSIINNTGKRISFSINSLSSGVSFEKKSY